MNKAASGVALAVLRRGRGHRPPKMSARPPAFSVNVKISVIPRGQGRGGDVREGTRPPEFSGLEPPQGMRVVDFCACCDCARTFHGS